MRRLLKWTGVSALLLSPGLLMAQTAAVASSPAVAIDTASTTWLLVSTALVMIMTPGLAFFYGGMVRRKNVLGTIMHSFIALCVVSIVWVAVGYSLSFSPDMIKGFVGGFNWTFLSGVTFAPDTGAGYETVAPYVGLGVPHMAYMIFQMMFAVITPALITGAFAERFKFSTYLVFLVLWSILVYTPLAHSVWSSTGWLFNLGALDFAGGLVVHMSSGFSALVAAIMVGKRKGFGQVQMSAANPALTVLGAALLWFGWFGFNAGSAISTGATATSAFVVTHIATAAAGLTWMLAEWIKKKKPSTIGAASGAVAGLVAITPASGYVSPVAALIIGGMAGIICYLGVHIKTLFGYDDSLDVVGVHGVGGAWGAIATGLFAGWWVHPSAGIAMSYQTGLFKTGDWHQLWVQLAGVGFTFVYSVTVTAIILLLLKFTMGLRVKEADEEKGLDESLHGESF